MFIGKEVFFKGFYFSKRNNCFLVSNTYLSYFAALSFEKVYVQYAIINKYYSKEIQVSMHLYILQTLEIGNDVRCSIYTGTIG
jgi:hypothetical protein